MEIVGTILDSSGVGPGGITRVLTEVVRYWPAAHPLTVVAAPGDWEPPADRSVEVEVASRQVGDRARSIAAATTTLRRLTAGPTDRLVLSMSPSIAVTGSRLPVTTIVHDLAFKLWPRDLSTSVRQYRRASYAAAIKRSARLVCVSARTVHDIYGLYGVGPERTTVWHPGSDLSVPAGELPAALAGRQYLAIAGHAAHKGVELAVEALVARPRYLLAVLTGGQRIEQFEAAVARAGVGDRVLFLPRLTDPEYVATVAQAAAFLMPSHFEGFGLPAAEALRLGTPTIISPDPALLEATDGAAIRMTSWTAEALVRALDELDGWRPVALPRARSWRDATGELVAGLSSAVRYEVAG